MKYMIILMAVAAGCDTCILEDSPVRPSDRPTSSEQPARSARREQAAISGELHRNAMLRLDRESVGPHEVIRATVASGTDIVMSYRRMPETYDNRTDQGHVERIFIRISQDIGLGKHGIDGTKIAIHYEEEGMAVIGNSRTSISGAIELSSIDVRSVTASLNLMIVTDDEITRIIHDTVEFTAP